MDYDQITLTIELYQGGAYIGDSIGGSGIEVDGNTTKQLVNSIGTYITDYIDRLKKH